LTKEQNTIGVFAIYDFPMHNRTLQ